MPPWTATDGRKPRWRAAGRVRGACDECSARQHETRGQYGPRGHISEIRTITTSPPPATDTAAPVLDGFTPPTPKKPAPTKHALRLCARHAALWRTRDEETSSR